MILRRIAEIFPSQSFASVPPLPTDEAWNRYNNTYNHAAYQTVCNEFDVDPKSDWRLNRDAEWLARGPGSIFTRFGPKLQSYLRQSAPEAEAENWGVCPFWGGDQGPHIKHAARAEAYLCAKFHLDPSNCLATVHQRYRQTGQDRPHGLAAQFLPFLVRPISNNIRN